MSTISFHQLLQILILKFLVLFLQCTGDEATGSSSGTSSVQVQSLCCHSAASFQHSSLPTSSSATKHKADVQSETWCQEQEETKEKCSEHGRGLRAKLAQIASAFLQKFCFQRVLHRCQWTAEHHILHRNLWDTAQWEQRVNAVMMASYSRRPETLRYSNV
jgi:hypothetical protein